MNLSNNHLARKVCILTVIAILVTVFVHQTRVIAGRGTINSLVSSLSGSYLKAQMMSGQKNIDLATVAASCGMGQSMQDMSGMKVTMDCHDSKHVKIRVASVQGAAMDDMTEVWTLPAKENSISINSSR